MSTNARSPRQRLTADARRSQLEAATIEIVGQIGYQATSADAIAQAASVSKGLLWHYYGDLDDLMAAAARRAFDVLSNAVIDGLDRSLPIPDLLRAAIRRAAQLPGTHGTYLLAVRQIAINLRNADGSLRLDASEYDQLYAGQETLLRHGQQLGQLRSDLDPRLLAVTYQGAIDSMIDHLMKNADVDADAYASLVADVLLGGMERGGPEV